MVPARSPAVTGTIKSSFYAAAGLLFGMAAAALGPSAAHAGSTSPVEYEVHSRVDTVISPPGGGLTTFNYTVNNTSFEIGGGDLFASFLVGGGPTTVFGIPIIVDWELPYFADANIVNIMSPTGWTYEIETVGVPNPTTGWLGGASWQDPFDPFHQPGSPFNATDLQVIHWYSTAWAATGDTSDGLLPGDSLAGFSLDSDYATSVNAPYQASWDILPVLSGDPPFPGGVNAGVPGSPSVTQVPEPAVLAVFAFGLAGIALSRRRRRV